MGREKAREGVIEGEIVTVSRETTRDWLDLVAEQTVEQNVMMQLRRQNADGEIDERWAAAISLALCSARTLDAQGLDGKAYGIAELIKSMRAAIELLPEPVQRDPAEFEAMIRAITGDEDEGE